MTRTFSFAGAGVLLVMASLCVGAPAAWATSQEKQSYSPAEYNAYIAASKETNPQQRIRLLDDFVAKYPNVSPELLLPAYRIYYKTYNDELKNYPKTIEYTDRLLSFGDKVDVGTRFEALYIRAVAFHYSFSEKVPDAKAQATRAREAALEGLKVLGQLQKPDSVTAEQFAQNKKGPEALFHYTAGFGSLQLKDYKAAIDSFKEALTANPTDGVTYFRLGVAYLQMSPPQQIDGFWALARSVALKGPGEAQVRAYLRNQLQRYQQTSCEKEVDPQMNELITLATSSAERPPDYKIPSAAELDAARQTMTVFGVLSDLKAGGERAKLAWLASCGLEFPDVPGKLIESSGESALTLKLFSAPTQEEIEAGTTANMEVKVEGQPEAKRLKKDDLLRFSATLASYNPEPFLLRWEKAKVNAEDIPEEKAAPVAKPPAKRPAAKKPPAKRPAGNRSAMKKPAA